MIECICRICSILKNNYVLILTLYSKISKWKQIGFDDDVQ